MLSVAKEAANVSIYRPVSSKHLTIRVSRRKGNYERRKVTDTNRANRKFRWWRDANATHHFGCRQHRSHGHRCGQYTRACHYRCGQHTRPATVDAGHAQATTTDAGNTTEPTNIDGGNTQATTTDAGVFTVSTCTEPITELFISEYIEGTDNNQLIEIYNGTDQIVSLQHYSLKKTVDEWGLGMCNTSAPQQGMRFIPEMFSTFVIQTRRSLGSAGSPRLPSHSMAMMPSACF